MSNQQTNIASEPERVRLRRDTWGRLELVDAAGQHFTNVNAIPMFPFSDPERWVSLCATDGREIICIEDLGHLTPEDAEVLHEVLAQRVFVPRLTRIVEVSSRVEPCEWHVETDRGPARLMLANEEDVRRLPGGSVLVVDAFGVRFLVSNLSALDAKSRRVLEWYV